MELPESDYNQIVDAFKEGRYCTDYEGEPICTCESEDDESYPEIVIKLSSTTQLSIKNSWYLKYHSDSLLGYKYCRLRIKQA